MEENKPWYASKGVWGGVGTVLSVIAGLLGYTVGPEDVEEFAIAGAGLGAAAFGIISLIGRLKASKKIG